MRIATWNIERLKHKKDIKTIIRLCEEQEADIFVLTETDEQVRLNLRYGFHTPKLSLAPSDYALPTTYKSTENRVSIFTRFPCIKQHDTYDQYTALCVELETDVGNLLVYGTVIGVTGNRSPSFQKDLLRQVDDFKQLSNLGNLCICGDFNCSFADNYYFTKFGRDTLLDSFSSNAISLLTKERQECIDHIALSQELLNGADIQISEWNLDKTMSDHKGISVKMDLTIEALS